MEFTGAIREAKKGAAELVVLAFLDDEPRHGYELTQLIVERSGGALTFNFASLYATLYKLACHLSELQESSTRRGASDEEARQIALDALNAASFLELSKRPRARHGGYLHDLRVAVRQLIGTPVVTTVAILSLALGIGANTAIFSLLNSLVLRALLVKDPHRLAILTDASAQGTDSWTYPIWRELQQRQLFHNAFAWGTE